MVYDNTKSSCLCPIVKKIQNKLRFTTFLLGNTTLGVTRKIYCNKFLSGQVQENVKMPLWQILTCSESTTETLQKVEKYVQI